MRTMMTAVVLIGLTGAVWAQTASEPRTVSLMYAKVEYTADHGDTWQTVPADSSLAAVPPHRPLAFRLTLDEICPHQLTVQQSRGNIAFG